METIKNVRPSSVKLTQSVTGKIGWEVRAEGETNDEIMAKINELHESMEVKFGGNDE